MCYSRHVRYLGCPLLGGFNSLYFFKQYFVMHNLESIRFCEILKILVRRTSFEMLVTPSCTWFSSPSQSSDDSKIFLRSFDQVITDMSLSNPVSDWYYRISTKGQILGGMTKFPQKNVLIWNRPPRLMGFTSLWQIQHIFSHSLPLALT